MIRRRFEDHSGLRLAVFALYAIRPDSVLRMVWAKIIAIDCDVLSAERFCHPMHERVKISLRVELSRDARLIGDDDERVFECLGMSAEIEDAGCEFYLLRPMQIADFPVDNSISIQK